MNISGLEKNALDWQVDVEGIYINPDYFFLLRWFCCKSVGMWEALSIRDIIPGFLWRLGLDEGSMLRRNRICTLKILDPGKFPKVPGRRRGTRGFPAAPRERPRESFFNPS